MAEAVAQFLRAAGVDLSEPELRKTPSRVAEAWDEQLLDGYRTTPSEALGRRMVAPQGAGLILVTGLQFHSLCPHHLLPVQGVAHIAYLPGPWVAGLGRLARLLNCFAHRLILQEALARDVARALAAELEAPGTACILEATHGCLRVRGEKQQQSRVYTAAYQGELAVAGPSRKELQSRIEALR